MSEQLLVINDAFVAKGAGVLVMPRITAKDPARGKFVVELRFADGTKKQVPAELDVAHMRGPLPPFAMYRLHDVTPEDLPAGTEVWSVP